MYDQLCDELLQVYSLYDVAYINYWSEELSYCYTLWTEMDEAICLVGRAVMAKVSFR